MVGLFLWWRPFHPVIYYFCIKGNLRSIMCGLVFCVECVSHSVMSNSLQPHGLGPARLLHLWNSPGQNTAVDCHFLLQGILLTQGSNLGLLHCKQTFNHLSHSPSWRLTNTAKVQLTLVGMRELELSSIQSHKYQRHTCDTLTKLHTYSKVTDSSLSLWAAVLLCWPTCDNLSGCMWWMGSQNMTYGASPSPLSSLSAV